MYLLPRVMFTYYSSRVYVLSRHMLVSTSTLSSATLSSSLPPRAYGGIRFVC